MTENEREMLPWRRYGIAVEFECEVGRNMWMFEAHYNFYSDGRLGECFCKPCKTGADLEPQLDKFCIVLSIALQFGADINAVVKTITSGAEGPAINIFDAIAVVGAREQANAMAEIAAGVA
jgi:hypothetical protein